MFLSVSSWNHVFTQKYFTWKQKGKGRGERGDWVVGEGGGREGGLRGNVNNFHFFYSCFFIHFSFYPFAYFLLNILQLSWIVSKTQLLKSDYCFQDVIICSGNRWQILLVRDWCKLWNTNLTLMKANTSWLNFKVRFKLPNIINKGVVYMDNKKLVISVLLVSFSVYQLYSVWITWMFFMFYSILLRCEIIIIFTFFTIIIMVLLLLWWGW